MLDAVANVALGLLTSAIYDVIKYTGGLFVSRLKNQDEALEDQIRQALAEQFPQRLSYLLEASTFAEYFSSAQLLDVVNAYLEYTLVCHYTGETAKLQKLINKSGRISAEDVTRYIGGSIHALYLRGNALRVPAEEDLRAAAAYILSVTERVLAQNLSTQNGQLLYLINTRADKLHDEIARHLTELEDTVARIEQRQLTPRDESYEQLREKYHAVLKQRNADAHIYLLDKFPFEKFYVPPVLQIESEARQSLRAGVYHPMLLYAQPGAWREIFTESSIVYLTGGAGYGKTLFTKKLINDFMALELFRSEDYLVICGELKAFYPNGSDSALSVVEYLKSCIKSSTLMDVPTAFVEHYLNAGRCLILLDALDEVEKTKRAALHETVIAFFKTQNPNNRVCLTSRERGFIPERDVTVFRICPLTERQIEQYVDRIIALGRFEPEDKGPFMQQSAALVRKGFLNSFLVLSLLINIYKAERELPENKLELYQKCFEYISNRREKDKTQREFDWRSIAPIMKDNTFIELARMGMPNNTGIDRAQIRQRLLQVYKTKYGSEAEAENAIEEFLRFCADRTELFVPTGEDQYRFFHRSFFEYFYSLYMFLHCPDAETMLRELLQFDVDSEVFELTVGMLKQQAEERYQALVGRMFALAEAELAAAGREYPVFNALILSMQVIDDVLYRQQFLQLLLSWRGTLLRNIRSIHNLRLVSVIFAADDQAGRALSEAYLEDGVLALLNGCIRLYRRLTQLAGEEGQSAQDVLTQTQFCAALARLHRVSWQLISPERCFYLPLLVRQYDCRQLLLTLAPAEVPALYWRSGVRIERQAAKAAEVLTCVQAFSAAAQEQFMSLLLPPQAYGVRGAQADFKHILG